MECRKTLKLEKRLSTLLGKGRQRLHNFLWHMAGSLESKCIARTNLAVLYTRKSTLASDADVLRC